MIWNRARPRMPVQNQQRELVSTRKTSHINTTTKTWAPTLTLTWHASKYKVHKLHQRHILKKGALRWYIYIPCVSGTLSNTGVCRHKTEPIFILTGSFDLEIGSRNRQVYIHLHVNLTFVLSQSTDHLKYGLDDVWSDGNIIFWGGGWTTTLFALLCFICHTYNRLHGRKQVSCLGDPAANQTGPCVAMVTWLVDSRRGNKRNFVNWQFQELIFCNDVCCRCAPPPPGKCPT